MKKKLSTILIAFVLLMCSVPNNIYAEVCTEHTWGEWYEIFDPSCLKDGVQRRDCKDCYEQETSPIPAIGHHTWEEWEIEYEPSCDEEGTEMRKCTICHENEEREIPKTNKHSWKKWTTVKKATALSDGKKTRFCSECYKKESKSCIIHQMNR